MQTSRILRNIVSEFYYCKNFNSFKDICNEHYGNTWQVINTFYESKSVSARAFQHFRSPDTATENFAEGTIK